jgi:hypothetical protein
VRLFGESGGHLVPGGARLRGVRGVDLARAGPAVLVYCPDQPRGLRVGRKRFAGPEARSLGFAGYGQDLIARHPC